MNVIASKTPAAVPTRHPQAGMVVKELPSATGESVLHVPVQPSVSIPNPKSGAGFNTGGGPFKPGDAGYPVKG